jgi:hypothetical protein
MHMNYKKLEFFLLTFTFIIFKVYGQQDAVTNDDDFAIHDNLSSSQ